MRKGPLVIACPKCGARSAISEQAVISLAASIRGKQTSDRKASSSAENGKRGGRPRKQPVAVFPSKL